MSIGREESPLLAKLMFAPDVRPGIHSHHVFPSHMPSQSTTAAAFFYSHSAGPPFPFFFYRGCGLWTQNPQHPRKAKGNDGMTKEQCDLKKLNNSLAVQFSIKFKKIIIRQMMIKTYFFNSMKLESGTEIIYKSTQINLD